MLVLGDNDQCGSGFLLLLSGLSKFDTIGGAISPDTADHKISGDTKEVDWIRKHWSLCSIQTSSLVRAHNCTDDEYGSSQSLVSVRCGS